MTTSKLDWGSYQRADCSGHLGGDSDGNTQIPGRGHHPLCLDGWKHHWFWTRKPNTPPTIGQLPSSYHLQQGTGLEAHTSHPGPSQPS